MTTKTLPQAALGAKSSGVRYALLASASVAAVLFVPDRAAADAKSEAAVFEQAEYWVESGRGDLATVAIQRLLTNDPQNVRALFELGRLYLADDQIATARLFLTRLEAAPGGKDYAARLRADLKNAEVDEGLIGAARLAAAEGDYDKAAGLYDQVFEQEPASGSLAVEYFQTIAGVPGRWRDAHDGLARIVEGTPGDKAAQLAFARVKTYDEKTRRKGVRMLLDAAKRKSGREAALDAAKDAFGWLEASDADSDLFKDYLAFRPKDRDVSKKFKAAMAPDNPRRLADARATGFAALQDGRLKAAETVFSSVLKQAPKDADAIAGLATVRLRQNRFADATRLFDKAKRLDGTIAADFSEAIGAAQFWRGHAAAQAAFDAGRYDEARRLADGLAPRDRGQRRATALLRGGVAASLGDFAAAEAVFTEALKGGADDPRLVAGLADIYVAQNRVDDLQRVMSALDSKATRDAYEEAQAWLALKSGDVRTAKRAYGEIVERNPDDPWATLAFARLLAEEGRTREAAALFDETTRDPAEAEAAAIFFNEQDEPRRAVAVLSNVSAKRRSPAANAQLARMERRLEIEDLVDGSPRTPRRAKRARLIAMADANAGSGPDLLDVASALLSLGYRDDAAGVARNAVNVSEDASLDFTLALIDVLAGAGDLGAAQDLLEVVNAYNADLTSAQRRRAARTFDNVVMNAGLKALEEDDVETALSYLEPLARDGQSDPAVFRALGAAEDKRRNFRAAYTYYRQALEAAPDDEWALKGAVGAALSRNDAKAAGALLDVALERNPTNPEYYRLAADVARQSGDVRGAIEALEVAKALQTGVGLSADPYPSGDDFGLGRAVAPSRGPGDNPFLPNARVRAQLDQPSRYGSSRADRTDGPAPLRPTRASDIQYNPYGDRRSEDRGERDGPYVDGRETADARARAARGEETLALNLPRMSDTRDYRAADPSASAAASRLRKRLRRISGDNAEPRQYADLRSVRRQDPALRSLSGPSDFNDDLRDLRLEQAFSLGTGVSIRYRDGEQGLGQLTDVSAPLDMEFAPAFGKVTIGLEPVVLHAGEIGQDPLRARRFGALAAGPIDGIVIPDIDTSAGVAFSIGFEAGDFEGSVGVTPLGFEVTNIVGDLQYTHDFVGGARISLGVERAAVTDSLLAYAGLVDPVTGEVFGGALANRLKAGVSKDFNGSGIYLNGEYGVVEAENTDDNTTYLITGGFYAGVLDRPDESAQAGFNVTYLSYEENRNFFTLGHAGYFSPQTFISASANFAYQKRTERLTLALDGALGYQFFEEDSVLFFPNRPDLQAAVFTNAGDAPSILEGDSRAALGLRVEGGFDYKLNDYMKAGGELSYNQTADWNEVVLTFRLRFWPSLSN
ncbi:MAG: cellulose synthase subunit BcsC-related outer membrane protein [Pseudomonadota bacterium]